MKVKRTAAPVAARQAPSLLAVPARTAQATFVLTRSAPLPLPAGVGTEIRCDRGSVWITQDYHPRDIVLERGQRFVLDADAPALVQAFDVAAISVTPPPAFQRSRLQALREAVAHLARRNRPARPSSAPGFDAQPGAL